MGEVNLLPEKSLTLQPKGPGSSGLHWVQFGIILGHFGVALTSVWARRLAGDLSASRDKQLIAYPTRL